MAAIRRRQVRLGFLFPAAAQGLVKLDKVQRNRLSTLNQRILRHVLCRVDDYAEFSGMIP